MANTGFTSLYDQVKRSLNWLPVPNPQQKIAQNTMFNAASKFIPNTPTTHINDQLANMDRSYRN